MHLAHGRGPLVGLDPAVGRFLIPFHHPRVGIHYTDFCRQHLLQFEREANLRTSSSLHDLHERVFGTAASPWSAGHVVRKACLRTTTPFLQFAPRQDVTSRLGADHGAPRALRRQAGQARSAGKLSYLLLFTLASSLPSNMNLVFYSDTC